jgi:hypothetical protein
MSHFLRRSIPPACAILGARAWEEASARSLAADGRIADCWESNGQLPCSKLDLNPLRGIVRASVDTMLRGTRTQYLWRRANMAAVFGVFCATTLFSIPVVLSTGWWRIVFFVLVPPVYILMLLVMISGPNKHLLKERAKQQQEATRYGDGVSHVPGYPSSRATQKALAFAKRVFGRERSD